MMSMDSTDFTTAGESSECCGASVYNDADEDFAICSECKEWAKVVKDETE